MHRIKAVKPSEKVTVKVLVSEDEIEHMFIGS